MTRRLDVGDHWDAHELGLEDYCSFVEIWANDNPDESGTVHVLVTVNESLDFHAKREAEILRNAPEWWASATPKVFDDGELTQEGMDALFGILADRYDAEQSDTDGHVVVWDTFLTSIPAETTEEELGELILRETQLVKWLNETDPGTFGSEYLFGSIIEKELSK